MTLSSSSRRTVFVSPDQAGLRLDKFLTLALADVSRARVQNLIHKGHVRLGTTGSAKQTSDRPTIEDTSYTVKQGECFEVAVPPPEPARPEAQAIPLNVIFEDDHLIVISKPAGLVVHPAPGNVSNTLVNALIAHCGASLSGIGGIRRPGIVHRLDKDTSGLLVAAKTDAAHQGLSAQFAAHSIERAYLAVVWGVPSPSSGLIEGAIGRSTQNRKKMAIVKTGGRPARTRYKIMETFGPANKTGNKDGSEKGQQNNFWASLVECRLETGRTHQIRVHLAAKGYPVIGDATYGRGRKLMPQDAPTLLRETVLGFARQALHAYVLGFTHPITQEELFFREELPKDMADLVALFRGKR